MRKDAKRRVRWLLAMGSLAAVSALMGRWQPAVAQTPAGIDAGAAGAVYTMSNSTTGNQVMAYSRSAAGFLRFLGAYSTQGTGNGSTNLASQGAVILASNHKYLYVVNSLSNEISAFAVQANGGLVFVNKVDSGGTEPVSLTAHGSFLFVTNQAGTSPNIVGFSIGSNGALTAINGAVGNLSSSTAGPAQVGFNPNGTLLVVTEKRTSQIDTFTVDTSGIPTGPLIQTSNGLAPFGFAFDNRAHLIVSEAAPSAMSSYSVSRTGILTVISGSVPDTQKAACWVVNTNNSTFPSQYSYTTNTGSATISSYTIGSTGTLTLLNALAATQLADDLDMALSTNSSFLYVLDRAVGTIAGFSVASNGSLTSVTSITGVATTSYGLAAY
jgi:6-phosphogluconolactonase